MSRKLLTVSALGVAAFALIGAGADAAFNDSVNATQSISTGTFSMAISSTDANNTPDGVTGPDGKSITFTVTNSGSAINQEHHVTITNTGTLALVMSSASVTAAGTNDSPLNQEVNMNLDGYNMPTGITVAGAQSTAWACQPVADCTIAVGASYTLPLNFFGDLSNAAQHQTITPKLTIGATEANPSAFSRAAHGQPHFAPVAKG
jgi:predicted ribosomally synthesized peptide with SipW-like signal peptide